MKVTRESNKDRTIGMFITMLFIRANNSKQPKCPKNRVPVNK